jgi:exosortase B
VSTVEDIKLNLGSISPKWTLALLGLAALYVPVYSSAWGSIWASEDLGHMPIIVVIIAWLFWSNRHLIGDDSGRSDKLIGAAATFIGLSSYFFGRIFNISSIEFFSHLPLIVGIVLILAGRRTLLVLWFPILYLLFLVPLPATVVDNITGPLKDWISFIVVEIISAAGYPIGRSGVIITIGQYQLLVADACSGLHSMISLSALGTLFVFLMNRKSKIHNVLMCFLILPIAFAANLLRVVFLILITYYLGDEVAQGFLHGFAGYVLMLSALTLLFIFDALFNRFSRASS